MKRKIKLIRLIILPILLILLTCCRTTKNENEYIFPKLPEYKRCIDEIGNITVYDSSNEIIFYYDVEKDFVTIPGWYWLQIINFGIDTNGI